MADDFFIPNPPLDMHHLKTYIYINFQQNQVKTQVMTVHTSLFVKNSKLHKFARPMIIFKKSTLSNMQHRKTYMHINFQQNWVSRSVKNCAHKFICKKLQFAEICNLQLEFRKITLFGYAQGCPQDLAGGGQEFFSQIWKSACREATCCAWPSHALC